MIFLTMIARVADGLPLTASIQEDEQVIFIFILNWNFFVLKSIWLIVHDVLRNFKLQTCFIDTDVS